MNKFRATNLTILLYGTMIKVKIGLFAKFGHKIIPTVGSLELGFTSHRGFKGV